MKDSVNPAASSEQGIPYTSQLFLMQALTSYFTVGSLVQTSYYLAEQWYSGTEVSLYGVANCTYDVTVDGASSSFQPGSGQLFHTAGLDNKTHNVTLVAHASNGSAFSFDRADITRPLSGYVSSFLMPRIFIDECTRTGTPTSQAIPATNTNFIKYNGNWTQQTDPNGQIPSKDHPAPYYEVQTTPASLSFSFQGSGVAVNGSRNWGSYTYQVVRYFDHSWILSPLTREK